MYIYAKRIEEEEKVLKIKNIIFDVDGTLWDSAKEVAESWTEILKKHDETKEVTVTREDMYRYMGHTMRDIGLMMLPEIEDTIRKKIMDECMVYEDEYLKEHSGEFYEGLFETVFTLRQMGISLFIVSNCQEGYIETLIEDGGFSLEKAYGEKYSDDDGIDIFDFTDIECYGHTGFEKAENIKLLIEKNNLIKDETVYFGDTEMDEKASNTAGISFIHAAYGFGKAVNPIFTVSDIRLLPKEILEYGKN